MYYEGVQCQGTCLSEEQDVRTLNFVVSVVGNCYHI